MAPPPAKPSTITWPAVASSCIGAGAPPVVALGVGYNESVRKNDALLESPKESLTAA